MSAPPSRGNSPVDAVPDPPAPDEVAAHTKTYAQLVYSYMTKGCPVEEAYQLAGAVMAMNERHIPPSPHALAVLGWVNKGCPEGKMPQAAELRDWFRSAPASRAQQQAQPRGETPAARTSTSASSPPARAPANVTPYTLCPGCDDFACVSDQVWQQLLADNSLADQFLQHHRIFLTAPCPSTRPTREQDAAYVKLSGVEEPEAEQHGLADIGDDGQCAVWLKHSEKRCRTRLGTRMPFLASGCAVPTITLLEMMDTLVLNDSGKRVSNTVKNPKLVQLLRKKFFRCAQYSNDELRKGNKLKWRYVKVDEVTFGKTKYSRGKNVREEGQVWYVSATLVEEYEDAEGVSHFKSIKTVWEALPDQKKETLLNFIQRVIPKEDSTGVTVVTDEGKPYLNLADFVRHDTVNHSISFKQFRVHTNNAENSHKVVKEQLKKWGGMRYGRLSVLDGRVQLATRMVFLSDTKRRQELLRVLKEGAPSLLNELTMVTTDKGKTKFVKCTQKEELEQWEPEEEGGEWVEEPTIPAQDSLPEQPKRAQPAPQGRKGKKVQAAAPAAARDSDDDGAEPDIIKDTTPNKRDTAGNPEATQVPLAQGTQTRSQRRVGLAAVTPIPRATLQALAKKSDGPGRKPAEPGARARAAITQRHASRAQLKQKALDAKVAYSLSDARPNKNGGACHIWSKRYREYKVDGSTREEKLYKALFKQIKSRGKTLMGRVPPALVYASVCEILRNANKQWEVIPYDVPLNDEESAFLRWDVKMSPVGPGATKICPVEVTGLQDVILIMFTPPKGRASPGDKVSVKVRYFDPSGSFKDDVGHGRRQQIARFIRARWLGVTADFEEMEKPLGDCDPSPKWDAGLDIVRAVARLVQKSAELTGVTRAVVQELATEYGKHLEGVVERDDEEDADDED